MGKLGGARVIYFNRLENGVIYLMVIYAKAVRGNIPAHLLKAIKDGIESWIKSSSRVKHWGANF